MCWELAFSYYGVGCAHREHYDLIELCREAQQSGNESCRPLAALRTIPCWGECRSCRGAGPAIMKRYMRVPGGEVEVTDQCTQMTSPSPTEEEVHDDAEASKAQVRFDVKGKEPMRTSESTPGPSNWASKESQGKSWSQTDNPHINSIGWGNEASKGYVEIKPKESVQSLLDKQRQRFSSDDEALAYTLKESIRGLQGFSIGDDSPNEEGPTKEVEHPSFQAWVEDDQRMFSGPSNAPSKETIQPMTSLEQRPDTPIEAFDSSVEGEEEEEEEEDVDGDDIRMASTEEECPGSRAESYDEKQAQQAAPEASQRESEKRNARNGSEDAGRVDSVSVKEKATPPDDDPDELYCSQ